MATKYKSKRDGYWYVKYKDAGGTWKNKFCGKNATASDAETVRKLYDAQELNQRHDAAIRIVDADLLQSLEHYRDTEIPKSRTGRPKSRKSIQRYQAIIDNLIEFFLGKKCSSFSSVTEKLVKEFFDGLITELNRSASTIEKHRQITINFFDWAIGEHYTTLNPATGVPAPKRTKPVPRFFSEEELQQIFSSAKGQYKNIYQFLYLTGIRSGELCNLEWTDYIEAQRKIVLRVLEGNKTKREEVVPLNESAVRILEEQKEIKCSKWVFTTKDGEQLDGSNLYRSLMTILKNNKIENAKPHTFRHTCASHLAIKGVSLYIIKEILRHASIKETEIYAHLSKEAVATAIQLLTV